MAKIGNQGGVNIPPFYATAKHWLRKMTQKKNITANIINVHSIKTTKTTILSTFT